MLLSHTHIGQSVGTDITELPTANVAAEDIIADDGVVVSIAENHIVDNGHNSFVALPQFTFKSQPNTIISAAQTGIGVSSPFGSVIPTQSFLLGEDLLTFASLDTGNMSIAFQGNPILSQVMPQQQQHLQQHTLRQDMTSSSSANALSLSETASAVTGLTEETIIIDSESQQIYPDHVTYQHSTDQSPGAHDATVEELVDSSSQEEYVSHQAVVEQLVDSVDGGGGQVLQLPLTSDGHSQQSMVLTTPSAGGNSQIQIISLPTLKSQVNKDGSIQLHTELSTPSEFQFLTPQSIPTAPQTKTKSSTKLNTLLMSAEKKNGAKKDVDHDLQSLNHKSKYKCTFCSKLFAKNFDLLQHVRSHTGEKPFQCVVCGRAFAQKSNVKKHMATHKVWPEATKTLAEEPVRIEIISPPPEEQPIPSNDTDLSQSSTSTQPSSQESDQIITAGVTKFTTTEEGETTTGVITSSNAKMNVTIDQAYHCQYCSVTFVSYFKLKTHMLEHKDQMVYKCIHGKCMATFKELNDFVTHVQNHGDNTEFRCHMCNKNFNSLLELGAHQYMHSLYPNLTNKVEAKNHKCPHCGSRYSTPANLKHHLETTDHRYPCTTCKKVFHCERFLRRHLVIHTSKAVFVCDICKKGFKTEHYLKQHRFVHTSETPWQCDSCPQAFNRRDKLQRHRLIHDPVKKYKCPFKAYTGCEKAFNRADKLKAHIISHSGAKPYKCSYCNKSFSRRPHLNEHVRTHEGRFKYTCGLCKKGFQRNNVWRAHVAKCKGDTATTTSRSRRQSLDLSPSQQQQPEDSDNPVSSQQPPESPKVRRKVGRPRKIRTVEDIRLMEEREKNKGKRKPGRPKKVHINRDDDGNPIVVEPTIEESNLEEPISSQLSTVEFSTLDTIATPLLLDKNGATVISNSGEMSALQNVLIENTPSNQQQQPQHGLIKSESNVSPLLHSNVPNINTTPVDIATATLTSIRPNSCSQQHLELNSSHIAESNIQIIGSDGSPVPAQHVWDVTTASNDPNASRNLQIVLKDGMTFLMDEATQQILAQFDSLDNVENQNMGVVRGADCELAPATPISLTASAGHTDLTKT